jgi:hypothetical protein
MLTVGSNHCQQCGLDFVAARFQPPEPIRAQPRALDAVSSVEAQCAQHEGNAAIASCQRCGAFMCSLCRIEADGKALCATCFDRLRSEGELSSARTTFRSWRTLGLHLSMLGFFLWVFGLIIGPAALAATIRGIGQDRKNGEEGVLWVSVVSLVLGGFVTAGGLFFALAIGGAFRK